MLAAGGSKRMGRPKPLLPVDGETFLERCVQVLRDGGCRAVHVVLAAGDAEGRRAAESAGARVVANPDPASEQVASVRLGVRSLAGDVAAAVILPVDHPLVEPATIARLIDTFGRTGADAVLPRLRGADGHPLLLSRAQFPALAASLPEGLHTLLDAAQARTVRIDVEDEGVVADIDTPAEYAARFGHPPER